MRHLIDFGDLTREEWERLYARTSEIIDAPEQFIDACRGRVSCNLFYEPSTRTNFSFQTAMMRLGGSVFGFADPSSSSVSKGESIKDTVKMVSNYADVVVMRTPWEGSAKAASLYSDVPVINAGDGGHQHPTQTLTDLQTIRSLHGDLNNFTIGLCGDLKFGRTVHSLINAMVRYPNIHFILISPDELRIPDYLRQEVLVDGNIDFIETNELEKYMPKLDILYMTRVQRERFFNEEDYIRLKDSFILDAAKMRYAKENMYVLHPLPRVNEIATEVDDDPRAVYFKQAQFGVYVRMALIMTLLGLAK